MIELHAFLIQSKQGYTSTTQSKQGYNGYPNQTKQFMWKDQCYDTF